MYLVLNFERGGIVILQVAKDFSFKNFTRHQILCMSLRTVALSYLTLFTSQISYQLIEINLKINEIKFPVCRLILLIVHRLLLFYSIICYEIFRLVNVKIKLGTIRFILRIL